MPKCAPQGSFVLLKNKTSSGSYSFRIMLENSESFHNSLDLKSGTNKPL